LPYFSYLPAFQYETHCKNIFAKKIPATVFRSALIEKATMELQATDRDAAAA
jgi:hypothetical protein